MGKFGNLGDSSQGAAATETSSEQTQQSQDSSTINNGTTTTTTQATAPVDGNPNGDSASTATTLSGAGDNGKDNSSGEITGAKPTETGNSNKDSEGPVASEILDPDGDDIFGQNQHVDQNQDHSTDSWLKSGAELQELNPTDSIVRTPNDLEQVVETGTIQGKIYSSHPVANFQVGRFQFNNSTLTLDNDDDIAEFEGILNKLPLYERNKVRTLSLDAANNLAIETGRITKGFDDGSSRAMDKLTRENPKTGGEDMGTKESGQNT